MRSFLSFCLSLALSLPVYAQFPATERIVSPEIGADRTVTFRLAAPEATKVELASSGDIPQIPFGKTCR